MSSSPNRTREPYFEDEHDIGEEPADAPGLGKRVEEVFRKTVLTGVGALFMTEEGIRNLVGELKLPRELAGYVVGQTEKTKRELVNAVAREASRFFESANLNKELRKVLTGIGVEVNASIRFVDLESEAQRGEGKGESSKLRVKTKVMALSDEDEPE